MPIYEYVCGSCKKKTEVIQGMNDPRLKVCPHCGGKLTKAFSAPAIQFKGSGFYITDYPKGDKGSAPKSDGGKSDRAEKADKPAASTEAASKSEKSGASAESASSPASTTPSAPSTSTPAPASSTPSSSSTKD
jgi:putative FmdB family regulatory protein